jgi:hypothetical protein
LSTPTPQLRSLRRLPGEGQQFLEVAHRRWSALSIAFAPRRSNSGRLVPLLVEHATDHDYVLDAQELAVAQAKGRKKTRAR